MIRSRKRSHDTMADSSQGLQPYDNSISRSGKWTSEEEAFANQLIVDFESGALGDCPDGSTLRSYLAKKLNCAPMRISKKFAGRCIGKKVFQRDHSAQPTAIRCVFHLPLENRSQSSSTTGGSVGRQEGGSNSNSMGSKRTMTTKSSSERKRSAGPSYNVNSVNNNHHAESSGATSAGDDETKADSLSSSDEDGGNHSPAVLRRNLPPSQRFNSRTFDSFLNFHWCNPDELAEAQHANHLGQHAPLENCGLDIDDMYHGGPSDLTATAQHTQAAAQVAQAQAQAHASTAAGRRMQPIGYPHEEAAEWKDVLSYFCDDGRAASGNTARHSAGSGNFHVPSGSPQAHHLHAHVHQYHAQAQLYAPYLHTAPSSSFSAGMGLGGGAGGGGMLAPSMMSSMMMPMMGGVSSAGSAGNNSSNALKPHGGPLPRRDSKKSLLQRSSSYLAGIAM